MGDWVLDKSIGANLEDFLGEAGTPLNIAAVVNTIRVTLTYDLLVSPGDLEVIPMPIGKSMWIFRLIIRTPRGELTETMAYDSDATRFIGL